jgi:hypothetical protein
MKTLGMEREWRRRYVSDAGLKRGKMGRSTCFLKALVGPFGIGLELADAELLQLFTHGLSESFQPAGELRLVAVCGLVGVNEEVRRSPMRPHLSRRWSISSGNCCRFWPASAASVQNATLFETATVGGPRYIETRA